MLRNNHNIAKCVYSSNEQILTAKKDNTTDLFHHLELKHLVEYVRWEPEIVCGENTRQITLAHPSIHNYWDCPPKKNNSTSRFSKYPKTTCFTFKRWSPLLAVGIVVRPCDVIIEPQRPHREEVREDGSDNKTSDFNKRDCWPLPISYWRPRLVTINHDHNCFLAYYCNHDIGRPLSLKK